MKKRSILGCLGVVMFAIGCGGGDDFTTKDTDDESNDDALALAQLPQTLAEASCDLYLRCLPNQASFFGSPDQCAETIASQFEAQSFDAIEDAVDDGRVEYNAEKASACIKEIHGAACDSFAFNTLPSCQEAFVGSVERGGDCTLDEECTGVSICVLGDTCPGTCSALLDAGDACTDDDQCDADLVCSEATSRCVAPAEQGDPCDGDEPPCAFPLFCLGQDEDAGTPGTCMTEAEAFVGEEGDACDFVTGDAVLCQPGLACQVEDFTTDGLVAFCRKMVGSGDNCGIALPSICPEGQYCAGIDPAEGQLGGACEPLPEAGDDCAEATFTPCGAGLVCLNGSCEVLKANGASCVDDETCLSENCVDGGCAPVGACE